MTPDLNSDDYYKILGCSRNADDATLKKAYRKLAVKVSRAERNTQQHGSRVLFVDDYLAKPLSYS
jgi:preprotein translocase subunit Sec63